MDARILARAEDILSDDVVIEALSQAWLDSKPGTTGGTEQGGFVVEDDNEDRYVIRWPAGSQDELVAPPHEGCRVNGRRIVATFHTHPNTGDHYRQEPGRVDIRAISDDPDLKASDYAGEFVVSEKWVYLIGQSGQVTQVGTREDVLGGGETLIMATTLTENVLRDNTALTVAKVLSVANQRAEATGINAVDSLISVNQFPRAEGGAWQVEYGPQNAVGRRGGGLTVEVAADGETVIRVLRGQ